MGSDKLFCVGQKAFIEKDGTVLVVFDPHSGLDFPGGKIQEGEEMNLTESLRREVREETGLEIEIGDPFCNWYYKFQSDSRNYGKEVYLIGFRCRYLSGEVRLSDEHVKHKWVGMGDYRQLDDGSDYFRALEKYFQTR